MADDTIGRTVERIAARAHERGLRVGVAESLTSGRVATELGRGEGSSEWFSGSVVDYRTDVKEQVLGMTRGLDPCSARCAVQIAAGARRLLRADAVVSVTGVGGPDPQDGHPPGTVYLGWADGGSGSVLREFAGDPAEVVARSTEAALELLLAVVEGRPPVADGSGPG